MSPWLRAAGIACVLMAAAWAGLKLYSLVPGMRHGPVPAAAGESGPTADLAADPEPMQPLPQKIPEHLPEFALADASGKMTSVHAWDGHSLILNFWATWCDPCRREIPLLETLERQWSSQGVRVVGIAVDERAAVLSFAREMKIDYPLLIGEDAALDLATRLGFESPALPFTVFTDRRGQVVALFLGELHPPQVALILRQVEDLNADRVGLEQARRSISTGLRALGSEHS